MASPYSARFHLADSGETSGAAPVSRGAADHRPAAGATAVIVTDVFEHTPVMVDRVVELLAPVPAGTLLDLTLGGGGHAAAVLASRPDLALVGIDRDPSALAAAGARLADFADRVTLHRARSDEVADLLDRLGSPPVTAVLADLGVSSPQLDRPERGFSYRRAGPLDMRMDPDASRTADDVVNHWPGPELARLLAVEGEERFARRIAAAVVAARPVADTASLADVVRSAIPAPARRRGGHPAKRTFQAIRIAVNEELAVLEATIDQVLPRLAPGGRAVVIAYHSGEDRIVKSRFRTAAEGGCTCPVGLPCVCGAQPTVRLLRRGATMPTAREVAANPRAESARLRAVEALAPPPVSGARS